MGKKPGHIVLPNGDRYEPVVMRILEKDAAGRPRKLLAIDEDEEIRLDDDDLPNDFVVVLGLRKVFKGDFD